MNNTSDAVPADILSESGQLNYLITSLISKVRTAQPVKIISCTNAGDLSPIGYVDIQPLIQKSDGSGNIFESGIIYNAPYFRLQGGTNGVVIDPAVGDIGLAVFCDSDISKVKATKQKAAAGSKRKHSFSDAIYIGAIIGQAPTQFIQFNAAGITISSPNVININAPTVNVTATTIKSIGSWLHDGVMTITQLLTGQGGVAVSGGSGATAVINGNITQTGNLVNTGSISSNGKVLDTHIHGNVQNGGGSTNPPT